MTVTRILRLIIEAKDEKVSINQLILYKLASG